MGVKCTTPKSAVDDFFKRAVTCIMTHMLDALAKLGEECVVRIRNRDAHSSWIDHTGNLRSSIGYAVYKHGEVYMRSSFQTVLGGNMGQYIGREMVSDLANEYSKVFALVVMAGMDYADKVEALDNKDVLASTRVWAESVVESRLERAREEAFKEINSWKL